MDFQVTQSELMQRLVAVEQGKIVPGGGKHILIACMPKTGSTFLCTAIANVPGMNTIQLTFGHQRREQELCPMKCSFAHGINYVAQHHVRYSDSTQKILTSFGIFPVILTRNIFDCVVSMRDHTEASKLESPIAYLPAHFRELPREKQYDVIIDLMVPWYANFFACWADYKGPCMRLMYRHMIEDIPGTIMRILRHVDLEVSASVAEFAIHQTESQDVRFNVGKVGRGPEYLSRRQIARIEELFSNYSYLEGIKDILYMKKAG